MKEKKTFILDYNTWRCGDVSRSKNNRHGKGETYLLNYNGEMCCLGQFSLQLGCSEDEIRLKKTPYEIPKLIPPFSKKNRATGTLGKYCSTELANLAMDINDDYETTIAEKIFKLQTIFKKKGYVIEVKNLPKNHQKELEKLNAKSQIQYGKRKINQAAEKNG